MNTNKCPICEVVAEQISFAVLAPWISEILNYKNPFNCQLMLCKSCNFKFFSYRYSQSEMNKLYKDYRSDKYYKVRNKWEFWYSRRINDFFKVKENIIKRKLRIHKNLESNGVILDKINSCLDYGGDEGQFFPDHIEKNNKYLLDYSHPDNDNEFIRVSSIKELPNKVDLSMCCMVLEHVDQPLNLFLDLKKSSNGGWIYIEVPNDSFEVTKWHNSSTYRSFLNLISRNYIMFIFFDFLGGVYRNFFKKIPFFGVVKQSEHINYFSPQSLAICFQKIDSSAKIYDIETESVGGLKLGTIFGLSKVH